jgi:hypothetical protein
VTSIVLLADGASARVRTTSTGRIGLTILGREENDLSIRLTLDAEEARNLGVALSAAALHLEAQE